MLPGLPKLKRQAELETLAVRLKAEQLAKRGIFLAIALLFAVFALMAAIVGLIVWLSHGVGVVAACFIGAGILLVVTFLIVVISGPLSGQGAVAVAEEAARRGRRTRIREARRWTNLATMLLSSRNMGGKWGIVAALGLGLVAGLYLRGDQEDVDEDDSDIDDE
ncbi:MAG: hypothetical protein AAF414_09600 [Pseudomonadota bacterium]